MVLVKPLGPLNPVSYGNAERNALFIDGVLMLACLGMLGMSFKPSLATAKMHLAIHRLPTRTARPQLVLLFHFSRTCAKPFLRGGSPFSVRDGTEA